MPVENEMHEYSEPQGRDAANPDANEMAKIEKILRRVQEINREHGGAFGYDFEDWLKAWKELSC